MNIEEYHPLKKKKTVRIKEPSLHSPTASSVSSVPPSEPLEMSVPELPWVPTAVPSYRGPFGHPDPLASPRSSISSDMGPDLGFPPSPQAGSSQAGSPYAGSPQAEPPRAPAVLHGFRREEVPGDGNCFFHALIRSVNYLVPFPAHLTAYRQDNEHTILMIRYVLCTYADNHRDQVFPFLTGNGQHDFDVQLNSLLRSRVWNFELFDLVPFIAAFALGLHIVIYDVVDHHFNDQPGLPTIYLFRGGRDHYSVLRPNPAP